MKRILIFSISYFPNHVGGAEVAIREITNRIPESEIEFHLISNRYDTALPKTEKLGHVTVHRIGIATHNPTMADLRKFPLHLNKPLFQFLAYFKAKQLQREFGFDAIWAMMAHSTGVPAALFKGKFPKMPYVLSLQEGDPPQYIERKMRLFGPLFRRAFMRADVVQAISTFLGIWSRRMKFVGPLVVIPNGVDTTHFSQNFSEEELTEARDELGKKMGDVFLVTTSRLVYKNAIDDVISALPLLPENISFIIYGTGPEEEKLKSLTKELEVEDRVQFRGQITHEEMPLALRACDIFIRPSRSEGMGNSFIEAMAAGLPVIATQEGGITDFLFDERKNPDVPMTGWAVSVNSPEDIREAVKDILLRREKREAITATAKAMVRGKYDWDTISRDMKEKVFDPILRDTGTI